MEPSKVLLKYSVFVDLMKDIRGDSFIEETLKEGKIIIIDDDTGNPTGEIAFKTWKYLKKEAEDESVSEEKR